jgi:hypothetical protein
MRRLILAVPFLLFACAKAETPPADSAALAATPPALTDADVAGTWKGTVTPEGSDSVLAHWTEICAAGTCRFTTQEAPKDTTTATYVIEGDSVRATSSPYKDAMVAQGAMIVDRWVARFSGGQVTGHGMATLADKPDSVVMRYRFTGTKTP